MIGEKAYSQAIGLFSASSRARTYDTAVNSRVLYR